jgi:hypothetical protein
MVQRVREWGAQPPPQQGYQLQLQPRKKENDSLILSLSTNILSVKEIVMRCTTKVTLNGEFNCEVEIENFLRHRQCLLPYMVT